jgi:predicted ATPase
MERARTLAHPTSPTETRVIASYFAAHLHQLRGEARAAQDHAESAIALADDYGLSVWVALSRIIRGWARVEQGASEDGIDELRRGIAAYEATGARLWRAQSLGFLAKALSTSGQHDQALEAVVEAVKLARETGEDGTAADLHRVHGDVLLARSDAHAPAVLVEAEECLTRALTVARGQRAKSWELRAATSAARLYLQQGKVTKARRLIAPVVEWFSEGHDTADVKAARAILGKASVVTR